MVAAYLDKAARPSVGEFPELLSMQYRKRLDLHKHPAFYPVRNHLIDFLVERSRTFRDKLPAGYDRRHPPIVDPLIDDAPTDGGSRRAA